MRFRSWRARICAAFFILILPLTAVEAGEGSCEAAFYALDRETAQFADHSPSARSFRSHIWSARAAVSLSVPLVGKPRSYFLHLTPVSLSSIREWDNTDISRNDGALIGYLYDPVFRNQDLDAATRSLETRLGTGLDPVPLYGFRGNFETILELAGRAPALHPWMARQAELFAVQYFSTYVDPKLYPESNQKIFSIALKSALARKKLETWKLIQALPKESAARFFPQGEEGAELFRAVLARAQEQGWPHDKKIELAHLGLKFVRREIILALQEVESAENPRIRAITVESLLRSLSMSILSSGITQDGYIAHLVYAAQLKLDPVLPNLPNLNDSKYRVLDTARWRQAWMGCFETVEEILSIRD